MDKFFLPGDWETAAWLDSAIDLVELSGHSMEVVAELRPIFRQHWIDAVHIAATLNLPAQVRADAWFDFAMWADKFETGLPTAAEVRSKLEGDFPAFAAHRAKKNPDYDEESAKAYAHLVYANRYDLTRA